MILKWPIVEQYKKGNDNIVKVEYFSRITELIINSEKCKICQQCVKACPKNALEMPRFPKGIRVPRKERVPILPDPLTCKFCGVCMHMCPYDAISMKCDGQEITVDDLGLSKANILPKIQHIKVKQFELTNPDFTNDFWEKIISRI